MTKFGARYGLFAIWLLFAAACPTFAEQARLHSTGKPNPFISEYQRLSGINDRGDAVGEGAFERSSPHRVTYEALLWTGPAGTVSGLGWAPGDQILSSAKAISANGNVIVGASSHGGFLRAFRRSSGSLVLLEPIGVDDGHSSAEDVSQDGLVIVGYSEKWSGSHQAFRWTSEEGVVSLGTLAGGQSKSIATGVSGDGAVIVGQTDVTGGSAHAFRWTSSSGMVDLGTIGGAVGRSYAYDVSPDGDFIVGGSATPEGPTRAYLYTEAEGMIALPTIGGYPGVSYALSVSADGKTIAGTSASAAFPEGEACVWFDGVPIAMRDMLAVRFGLSVDNFVQFKNARCSPDGLNFAGDSRYHVQPPTGTSPMDAGYRVKIAPDLQPPMIETDVEEGSTQLAKVGHTFRRTFRLSDPDEGGSIRINGFGRPGDATLTPPMGTESTEPIETVLEWTPTDAYFGKTFDCRIGYSDEFGTVHNRKFKIQVAANEPPTATAIEPKIVECIGGAHTVKLSTTVDDPENQPLLIKWFVNGELKVETPNVPSGTTLTFEHAYEHGTHDVQFRVFDGKYLPSTILDTTVTVQDTSAPIVIVTNHVTTSTDSGVDYATILDLPVPTASDASGHEVVSLENDGTGIYPLGETIVTWTATDEFGNVGTAIQKVTVIDTEKPSIAGSASMKVFVDPGKVFSTAKPPLPYASDNVTDGSQLKITSDAPARFPIGWTLVTFRATDDAGNFAEWPMSVGVANRKPRAKAGKNVSVTTTNERGLRVSLDGSGSLDLDQQKLKFAWSAPGVKLAGVKSAKPSGLFPVGTTVVKLTVTDPAGATHTDTVSVIVRLKNGAARPRGSDANRSFAAATQQAGKAVAAKQSSGAAPGSNSAALAGLAYANAASAYGDAAGGFVRWEEGQSVNDALLSYAEIRALQRTYGQAAASSLLTAYAETGDESLLFAHGYAASGTAYAEADLQDR